MYVDSDDQFKTAKNMLIHAKLTGYDKIRKVFIEEFNIPKQWITSFYTMTKCRPKIIPFNIEPAYISISSPTIDTVLDFDAMIVSTPPLIPHQEMKILHFIGNDTITLEE